ncbi:hypothetical protein BDP27DRAFT_259186 [Rhodocollybia butyracea]|uniref:Uncharacterized protein n=1 Tax=Rhodocollybia butyracea TaxID=206335 RepID=A0A9P5PGG9_9AGAR|nr:hypothetical protein BDP27DRAFT_259186 [Rhodocollybia butyracea]
MKLSSAQISCGYRSPSLCGCRFIFPNFLLPETKGLSRPDVASRSSHRQERCLRKRWGMGKEVCIMIMTSLKLEQYVFAFFFCLIHDPDCVVPSVSFASLCH